MKRTKAKNKVSEKIWSLLGSHNEKESLQSPQYLLHEFNSFTIQPRNALIKNVVRETVFPAGFMHYQSSLFSESQAAKTPGRHILGFSIKWVAGNPVSSYYGCSLTIVNPLSLPQYAFCIVHRDLRHHNDPVTGLPKVTPKPVNANFHPRVLCFWERYPSFSPTDLIVPQEYFHFLNTEHLSLLRQEIVYVLLL